MTRPALPVIPVVVAGAAERSGESPERAAPDLQQALGFPGELPEGWHGKAVARIGEQVGGSRSLKVAMDACMRCGACTDKCHFFLGDGDASGGAGDPKNMPVARQDLYRSVYKRHFTLAGKWLPKLVGARDLDESMLADWYNYFHQCTQCRRCTEFCPVGIDTAEISMAARDVMNHIGIGQRYTNEIAAKAARTGNNFGLPAPVIAETLEVLAEDVLEDTGVAVPFPLDVAGAEVLLVVPSADLFAEPHVEGLIGTAKVLHAAGVSWTLSTTASEAANFGLFIGAESPRSSMLHKVADAARELGVPRVVYGECGHAWRVAQAELPALLADVPSLDRERRPLQHIVELTHELLVAGRITLDASANDALRVTYHDSCNIARASSMGDVPGGQFELPRALLRAACNHFVDMDAETIRERTLCCGAGAGLLNDDALDVRRRGAAPRLRAFEAVAQSHDVTHLVAICAICKTQLGRMLGERDGSVMSDRVLSLHQVVGRAVQQGANAQDE